MNIKSTIELYAGQSGGSSLVPSDLPQQEKDIVRRRLVKTNPDIDSGGVGSGRHKEYPNWIDTSKTGVQVGKNNEEHVDLLNRLKLPSSGRSYDNISRGHAVVDHDRKVVRVGGGTVPDRDYPTNAVLNKFGKMYPHYQVQRDNNLGYSGTSINAMKYKEQPQKDNAGFIGKPYIVQDKQYGHYLSEHDSSASAELASIARPYSKVIRFPELSQLQEVRNIKRKNVTNVR